MQVGIRLDRARADSEDAVAAEDRTAGEEAPNASWQ